MRKIIPFLSLCLLITLGQTYGAEPVISPATPKEGLTFIPLFPEGGATPEAFSLMPLATNAPLEGVHPSILQAIIFIHDSRRDADALRTLLKTVAGKENGSTIILVPQFLLGTDITRLAALVPDKGQRLIHWSIGQWEYGNPSETSDPPLGISSFTAADLLLLYVSDPQRFPNLRHIRVAGYGLGADYVQRYAMTSHAYDSLKATGLDLRFIVLNPTSYLYPTSYRFRSLSTGAGAIEDVTCPTYNDWPFGLDHMNRYSHRTGESTIKLRFGQIPMTYLYTDQTPAEEEILVNPCSRNLQEAKPYNRAQAFAFTLHQLYGNELDQNVLFYHIPGVSPVLEDVVSSSCGSAYLLSHDTCSGILKLDLKIPE